MDHHLNQIRSGRGLVIRGVPAYWRLCLTLVAAGSMAAWSGTLHGRLGAFGPQPNAAAVIENEIDDALSQAAKNALGQREGTIIIIDPLTGRVRAVVNPQIAFENSYAPGSTIKPFTALAALRGGLIDKNSNTLCRERFARRGFATVCAHPRDLPPFHPSEAIAYSCNYYFGTLGERLDEELLSNTLSSFGFGKKTLINNDREQAGRLMLGRNNPRNALGEGDHLQATPIQLLMAYAALVNGGHLLTPRAAPHAEFLAHERAQLQIAPEHRAIVLEGMRGAVVYGTAARAGLNSTLLNGLTVLGKTGTSTPAKGFRTQGWFVGLAATGAAPATLAPENLELAVLVFLKRGHGADAAALSRSIFEEYGQRRGPGEKDAETRGHGDTGISGESSISRGNKLDTRNIPVSDPPRLSAVSVVRVRVHQVRENVTREMPLEDYVRTVVATEGSMEDQPEALKALAVAVRTYALGNLGRHQKDGYDFCTTTHCQRYQPGGGDGSGQQKADLNNRASEAVRSTAGEVLRDGSSRLVESYFSASCGGMTANIQNLWGTNPPPYLRGVRDDACTTMPHHDWTDVVATERLLQALRSDERTDPGGRLDHVKVTRRDATGRAELIVIEGERRRVVRGWDFKIIVGRKLGWNLLKSSRFEVARSGSNFVFRGTGFGHGLGLCQEGAHVMAQRGAGYEQILAKYFSGTNVSSAIDSQRSFADLVWNPGAVETNTQRLPSTSPSHSTKRTSLSSEHFRVSFPTALPQRDAQRILGTLERARSNLLQKVTAAGLALNQFPAPEIFINATTGDFVGRTGQPWWAAAATTGNLIELQPVEVLQRRGVLETTLRHELVHTLIDKVGRGRAPRWLAEGMALYFAGEGPLLSRYTPRKKLTISQIDEGLAKASSADEMRTAYAAAYGEVSALVRANGEIDLWRRIASGLL